MSTPSQNPSVALLRPTHPHPVAPPPLRGGDAPPAFPLPLWLISLIRFGVGSLTLLRVPCPRCVLVRSHTKQRSLSGDDYAADDLTFAAHHQTPHQANRACLQTPPLSSRRRRSCSSTLARSRRSRRSAEPARESSRTGRKKVGFGMFACAVTG
jgi:hypothetical protein